MRPILFSLGRLNFYSYGFFTAIGFLVGGYLINHLARKKRLLTKSHREHFLIDGLLISLIVAIIAARLAYILLYHLIFALEGLNLQTNLIGGGFIFYAGLLTGLAVFAWWVRKEETAFMAWLDVLIVGILGGLMVSAIGGYLNDGSVLHLVAWVIYLIMTALTYILVRYQKRVGLTAITGFTLLLTVNFFLGFWRTEAIQWLGLNLGQWFAIAALLGIGFYGTRSIKA